MTHLYNIELLHELYPTMCFRITDTMLEMTIGDTDGISNLYLDKFGNIKIMLFDYGSVSDKEIIYNLFLEWSFDLKKESEKYEKNY